MKPLISASAWSSLILNAALSVAAPANYCDASASNICFQWGVPSASAKSGSGDIFFQLSAPSTYQWVGLGIGEQMAGADMFLMYQDGKGNVTLSHRQGKGHVMPRHVDDSSVELLSGSGVMDDTMVANVRCGDCVGKLDVSGSSNWISAWKTGSSLDSSSVSESIMQHDAHQQFQVDLSKASISSDSNPFVTTAGSTASSTTSAGSTIPTSGSNSNGAVTTNDDDNGGQNLVLAHGIIMTLVFVGLFPIGSMLMPLVGIWWVHSMWQNVAFLTMWAGFGVGYVSAHRQHIFFDQTHTRLGIFVVCLMVLQPILGIVHHLRYRKVQKRTIFGHIHQWYGRILMLLGIVNGGLGLKLAGASHSFKIAYIVLAAVIGTLYILTAVFGVFKSKKRVRKYESPTGSMAQMR